MTKYENEQIEHLAKRYQSAGIDRRTFMKVASAMTAGTAVVAGVPRFVGASPAVGPQRRLTAQGDVEQVFYHGSLNDEPSSQDFNLNLYCNGVVELWAGLLTFDENLLPVADWAETFTPNEDASVWTFNIRQNNTGWSNGDPVTAHDFVYSWERQLNPANAAAYAGFLFDILGAEAYNLAQEADGRAVTAEDLGMKAIDDWTLEVTMQGEAGTLTPGSRGYFPQVVAYTAAVPSHRASVEEHGAEWALGDVPLVSNGPFKMDLWEHQVKVEMSKNPGYWNTEAIALDKVVVPFIPSSNDVNAYEAGDGDQQIDWAIIGATDLPRFQEDAELSTQLQPYVVPGIWMLIASNGVPPFDDLNVRLALNHAIDRERLVNLTNELVNPAFCMVPPGVFGYLDDPVFEENLAFDPAAAMAALEGTDYAGGTNWPPITMYLRGSEEGINSNIMAQDIAAQLNEVFGMDITLEVIPENNWRPRLFENNFQLTWIRWWYDYPDANNGYGDMFYSRKNSGKRQAWSNAEFDDVVTEAKGIADLDARLELYRQAETIIQNDGGYQPIVYRQDQIAYKPWVTNLPVNLQGYTVPQGNIYTRFLQDIAVEGRPE